MITIGLQTQSINRSDFIQLYAAPFYFKSTTSGGQGHPTPIHTPTHKHTKQVTWGHNIVADGWAGGIQPPATPQPHPQPPSNTLTHKQYQL